MSGTHQDLVGYVRVSTADQEPVLQIDALNSAGCAKVFTEHASGSSTDRLELQKVKEYLSEGDTLVVWRLDRLGRSLRDLVETINWLEDRGVMFRSVSESIDSSTPGGKLIFHVFASLAEFERDLVRERTHAVLAAARARGRKGGRPTAMSAKQVAIAKEMLAQQDPEGRPLHTVSDVAGVMHVPRATVYRALERHAKSTIAT